MSGPPPFPKLYGSTSEQARVQDSIGTQLTPVARAVAGTPMLNGTLPQWIAISLAAGFANLGGSFATAAYHKDALGYVHVKGQIVCAAGCAAFTPIFTLPMGFRPHETLRLPSEGVGAYQGIDVTTYGPFQNVVAIGAGGGMSLACSFLADG